MSTNQQHTERDQEMKEKFVFFGVFAIVVLFGMVALQGCVSADAAALTSTNWIVMEINGQRVMKDFEPTMQFGTTTEVSGNASCNSFFGTYKISGNQLSFDQLGNTEMWCMEDGVMDQETLFLQSLLKADTFNITAGKLTINLNDGGNIVLEQLESVQ